MIKEIKRRNSDTERIEEIKDMTDEKEAENKEIDKEEAESNSRETSSKETEAEKNAEETTGETTEETVVEADKTSGNLLENPYVLPALGIFAGMLIGFLVGFLVAGRKRKRQMTGRKKDSMKGNTVKEPTLSLTTEQSYIIDESTEIEQAVLSNSSYAVGKLHNIGKRSGQQDSFAVSDITDKALCESKGVIAIVADGMGGLADGDKISSMVTLSLFRHFHEQPIAGMEEAALMQMLAAANVQVNQYLGNNIGKCGSTLVAAIIRDRKCHWISVGDSHIYLYRNQTLLQLNREHVYREELDAKVINGEMSREQALQTSNKGALTSYIGMGRLEKVDRSLTPVSLQPGDRMLFMTDGVFGTLSDSQMIEAMSYPVEESVQRLDAMVRAVNKQNQDNYTAVILECR